MDVNPGPSQQEWEEEKALVLSKDEKAIKEIIIIKIVHEYSINLRQYFNIIDLILTQYHSEEMFWDTQGIMSF